MPTVKKQSATQVAQPPPTPSTNGQPEGSVVERIRPVQVRGGIKMVLYGRAGTGKTRFACTFPKPLLLIGTEDGTKSVSTVKGLDFVRIRHSDELHELVDLFKTGKYRTGVVDTAGGVQDMIMKEVCGWEEVPQQKAYMMAEQGAWMAVAGDLKTKFIRLFDLVDQLTQWEFSMVVNAHERDFTNENTTSEVMIPYVGASLTKNNSLWLSTAADYVGQMFLREQEIAQPVAVEGSESTVMLKTGKKEYCLRTAPHSVYQSKFRLPTGVELPEVVVDPTYDKIARLIRGEPLVGTARK